MTFDSDTVDFCLCGLKSGVDRQNILFVFFKAGRSHCTSNPDRQKFVDLCLCGVDRQKYFGPEWKAAFDTLGPDFRFGDAMVALKAKQGATGRFLKACEEYRLIEKLERGLYRKRVKTAPVCRPQC